VVDAGDVVAVFVGVTAPANVFAAGKVRWMFVIAGSGCR
jgi:hypothetical protein